MAKINEDMVIVKVSELIKDDQPETLIVDGDTMSQLEAIVQELVGPNKIVEVVRP